MIRPPLSRVSVAMLAALAAALGGCSMIEKFTSGDRLDYRSQTTSVRPLEVPPDLSQLARDSRYQVQGGVVSASGAASAAQSAAAPASVPVSVALVSRGDLRIERAGQERWLVLSQTPEQLWPRLRAFWEQRGFALDIDDPAAGVMETQWSENRAKLPNDVVRNTIGRLLGNLYDTGERDRFRTRVERRAGGSEVYISHRGAEEVYADERKETTTWRARASDPQLEAEMLSRLMADLAGEPDKPAVARAAVAAAPEQPARARALDGGTALEIDDPFDRAWRRVGLVLDRSGFSVEDRDRSAGVYYVRYVDPRSAGRESPGFWARLLGRDGPAAEPLRYRIAVQDRGDKTRIEVLPPSGGGDGGDNARRIASQLVAELR